MIARVSGTLLASDIDRVEVMTAGGVAYLVHIPLSVAESLPRVGGTLELHTALVVRDDGWTLYGFAGAADRSLFQRLLGTTGVGPSLAMNLLSALGGDRLVRAIQEKDLATLTRTARGQEARRAAGARVAGQAGCRGRRRVSRGGQGGVQRAGCRCRARAGGAWLPGHGRGEGGARGARG